MISLFRLLAVALVCRKMCFYKESQYPHFATAFSFLSIINLQNLFPVLEVFLVNSGFFDFHHTLNQLH